jgi:RimJ/RimL family protein N-acetyltransferase
MRNRDRFRESFPGAVALLGHGANCAEYIEARAADWEAGTGFCYGLWEWRSSALVGQVHLKHFDWEVGRAELAYLIDAEHEGRSLVREALLRTVAMCFDDLGLHKVFLRTIVGNERSARLARRCGFVLEGTLRGEFPSSGCARVDVHYFGLLASDERTR